MFWGLGRVRVDGFGEGGLVWRVGFRDSEGLFKDSGVLGVLV